jgi:small subunit ribosomal protein S1
MTTNTADIEKKELSEKLETTDTEDSATDEEESKSEEDKKIKFSKKRDGKKHSAMIKLLAESQMPHAEGDLVEGPVIAIEKSRVYVDLRPFGTGIIYGREFLSARDVLRKVNIGDNIAAKVIDTEGAEGYIELSLKEARQALVWGEAEEAIIKKSVFDLPIKEANKGGLILEWQGIQGFLPASQLKAEHYPRVTDGDKEKILEELKKLVGEKLSVSVITADAKEGKLIFSEKDSQKKEKEKIIDKYQIGDVIDGEVTGTVDFGIFVKLEEGLEGLVHISEIEWGLVEDPRALYSVGDQVKVKVIEIKDGKISLSIKALKENPWLAAEKKYKKGDSVTGVVIKYNKHGALASIEEGVAGLVHISEFKDEQSLRSALELGKTYPFKITIFEPKEQRMTLSFVGGQL